jgi:hypothetical protein
MVHCVCWTEVTDSSNYGALCVWTELTVSVMVHRVCWTEVTDSSNYGACGVLDGSN